MENRFLGSISASSLKSFFPKSALRKQKTMMKSRSKLNSNSENVPPADPNIQISDPPLLPTSTFPRISYSKPINIPQKFTGSATESVVPAPPNPKVKVVVRIRPSEGLQNGECIVKKVSHDSVSVVGNREYCFDSVFDANSTQEDVFRMVGVPLITDALAGYNTSLLAYGQSGSGKTYTMWGPPSALVGTSSATDHQGICPPSALVGTSSATDHQGIAPHVLRLLFAKIQQDKENTDGRQTSYQCRCSFIEIYNGQIGDLLDPTQTNLEIEDDAKNGFHIKDLTEECVTGYEDVTKILIKGLSRRKVVASTNSKDSRSHAIFTCTIDSWSEAQGASSKCFGSSSKTTRLSLVDLAGFESNILDDGALKLYLKDENLLNKSTSQFGNLINALVKHSHLEISQGMPFGSSLTHLLKESLGGNDKLSIICTIIPDKKYSSETASILSFGEQLLENHPVINEITESNVNSVPSQIRQLKEELIRTKSRDSISSNPGYYNGHSVRESLNQLRLGLNRSLISPSKDDNSAVAASANENDLEEELRVQMDGLNDTKDTDCCEKDLSDQYVSCSEESENEGTDSEATLSQFLDSSEVSSMEPIFSESPKMKNRKSMLNMSVYSPHQQNDAPEITNNRTFVGESNQHVDHFRSSLRCSKVFAGSTESLAASLHKGLEIIGYHQKKSTLDRSSVSFSFKNLMLKASPTVDKGTASSAQALPKMRQSSDMPSVYFLCRNCQRGEIVAPAEVQDCMKTWNVEEKNSNRIYKDADKVTGQPTEKEKVLENVCKEQEATIQKMNQQLIRCKFEFEQCSGLGYKPECHSSYDMKKLLTWDRNENHDLEVIKEECEPDQVNITRSVDETGKEDLLKEIASLRSQLQMRNAGPTAKSTDRIRSSLLAQSIQLRKSGAFSLGSGNSKEDVEKERERWTEMESEWICLTDELRIDLETQRQRAEQAEMELGLEKGFTNELDDALKRSILGQTTIVEQYAELQEKYNELAGKHQVLMVAVAEVKKAAAKAGAKGHHGSRYAKSLAAELSAARIEREREMESLRKENASLKTQLGDTVEAVHAAGELLVRLREAEETASFAEGNMTNMQEENGKLKKEVEKLKRKHKTEINTMKQYLAESRLPQSVLQPLYKDGYDIEQNNPAVSAEYDDDDDDDDDDDQAWRAEFGAIYQEHQHYGKW